MSRKVTVLSGLVVAALAAGSASAWAQAGGSPATRMPMRGSATERQFQFEGDLTRQQMNQQALAAAAPDRVARAQRVAALIDSGHCAEAEQLAAAEKDGQMMLKVRKICKKK